jgi:hypothetical protein
MAVRAVRSLYSSNEATLQGVVEMILDPSRSRVGELRLVMDGTKKHGSGRFGFVDIFVAVEDVQTAVILELKDIGLLGLANGRRRSWLSDPGNERMENLADEITGMTEEALDQLPYAYRSNGNTLFTTVGEVRRGAMSQLEGYVRVIGMGSAKVYSDSGVLDGRVTIGPGSDRLHSYSLVAVGGRRVLWQSGRTTDTAFSYRCTSA